MNRKSTIQNITGFFLAAGLSLILAAPVSAQPSSNKMVTSTPTVRTKDGWTLQLRYYSQEKIKNCKEAPVVVLLHMRGSDSLVWKNGMAEQLWQEGYAVVAVDFRMHGQSKGAGGGKSKDLADLKPNDFVAMVVQDMEAVKEFIYEEHQEQHLNMAKMGIIAPEMSAPIAANWAVMDWKKRPYDDAPTFKDKTPRGQDVKSIVFISPTGSLKTVKTIPAIRYLSDPRVGISMLFCVSSGDSIDKGETGRLYKIAMAKSKNDNKLFMKQFPGKLRGTTMIGQSLQIEFVIKKYLEISLKEMGEPKWRDRRNRITR